jgi:hypothetical protein
LRSSSEAPAFLPISVPALSSFPTRTPILTLTLILNLSATLSRIEADFQQWGFSGISTFAHLNYEKCLTKPDTLFDIAILGVPFDTAVSYRPGKPSIPILPYCISPIRPQHSSPIRQYRLLAISAHIPRCPIRPPRHPRCLSPPNNLPRLQPPRLNKPLQILGLHPRLRRHPRDAHGQRRRFDPNDVRVPRTRTSRPSLFLVEVSQNNLARRRSLFGVGGVEGVE